MMGSDGNGNALGVHPADQSDLEKQGNMMPQPLEEGGSQSSLGESLEKGDQTMLTIMISTGESHAQVTATPALKGNVSNTIGADNKEEMSNVATSTKGSSSRSESFHEQCRVCQQQTEEALINLGCQCRGGLANAHRSCIDTWFHTRGSNKCEICQQIAANVPPPESHPSRNYWIWRADPAFRAQGRERSCFSPLWVAFSILIGGVLIDVLISICLGNSALPMNIMIGVLILLGLGTTLRLALECCHEWSLRRVVERVGTNVNPGNDPAV